MKFVVLLRPGATDARGYVDTTLAVRRAVRELNTLDFAFTEPTLEQPTTQMRVLTWADTVRAANLDFFSDLENDVLFLQTTAATAEDRDVIRDVLERRLPVERLEDLRTAAASATGDGGRALVRLAYGSPSELDDGIAEMLRSALRDPDDLVRSNAGFAVAITTWPELLPALRAAADTESDPATRHRMDRYVGALRRVKRSQ